MTKVSRISIAARDTPLRMALTQALRGSGIILKMDANVWDSRITLNLRDADPETAARILTRLVQKAQPNVVCDATVDQMHLFLQEEAKKPARTTSLKSSRSTTIGSASSSARVTTDAAADTASESNSNTLVGDVPATCNSGLSQDSTPDGEIGLPSSGASYSPVGYEFLRTPGRASREGYLTLPPEKNFSPDVSFNPKAKGKRSHPWYTYQLDPKTHQLIIVWHSGDGKTEKFPTAPGFQPQ